MTVSEMIIKTKATGQTMDTGLPGDCVLMKKVLV